MDVVTLLEIAKISPYLVLPILFVFILWKVYGENTKFIKEIVSEKSKQVSEIGDKIQVMTDILNTQFISNEREVRDQHERLNEGLSSRIEILSNKIDAMRIEIARNGEKK